MQEPEEGVIAYEDCGVKMTVLYHAKDLEGSIYPQAGDKVRLCTRWSLMSEGLQRPTLGLQNNCKLVYFSLQLNNILYGLI